MTDEGAEYAIVANVIKGDTVLRTSARVWVLRGDTMGGKGRCWCTGLSVGGRRIVKWVATHRLQNFRSKWVPPGLRGLVFTRSQPDAAREAAFLDTLAQRERIDRLRRQAAHEQQKAAR